MYNSFQGTSIGIPLRKKIYFKTKMVLIDLSTIFFLLLSHAFMESN